jgi:hypothetical protein
MSQIIITEKQLGLITNKVLSEQKSEKGTINESLFSFENILMAIGFVPVIGEVADIALICYYLYKGEKLYAALMLIALIPTVGDFIAKPIIKLFKGSREGAVAMKAGGKTLTEYLAKNPQMAKKFSSLGKYVQEPAVQNTVKGIEKLPKVGPGLASKLRSGLEMITGSKALSGLKAGGKEVVAGGKFKTGLKDYFRGERLSKYFAKHGVLPEKGIQKWWINVSARQDRRNAFRTFIGTNNLLAYFGIPSLTMFELKMSEDAEFRKKVAEDPKTSDYIAKNYENEDAVTTQQTPETTPSKEEIDQYIKNRKSGNSASSLFKMGSINLSNENGFSNIFSTMFGGSPQIA